MTTQWFIIRNGKEESVSPLRLMEMGVLSLLEPTDLLRRADRDKPKTASEVNGLLPDWYVLKVSKQQGPLTPSMISERIKAKTLEQEDFLRRLEFNEWHEAVAINGVCQQLVGPRWVSFSEKRLKKDDEHTLADNSLWYLLDLKDQEGPYSTSEIKGMVQSGKLIPDDLILHPETSTWNTIRTFPLFDDQSLLATFPSIVAVRRLPQQIEQLERRAPVITGNTKLAGQKGSVFCLAFSNDGRLLASGGADNAIHIWDTTSHEEINCFEGHGNVIVSLAFSNTDNTLVSASVDGEIRAWRVRSGKTILSLCVSDTPVCAGLLPTQRSLVVVERHGRISLCNKAGELQKRFDTGSVIGSASLSRNTPELFVATVMGEVSKWGLREESNITSVPKTLKRGRDRMKVGKGGRYHGYFLTGQPTIARSGSGGVAFARLARL